MFIQTFIIVFIIFFVLNCLIQLNNYWLDMQIKYGDKQ